MRHLLILTGLLTLVLMAGCAAKEAAAPSDPQVGMKAAEGIPADHPELTEQEMYIACSDCHRDETPEIVDQWWNSAHGIGSVKCYQCHGTYENMMKVPAQADCMACHEEQVTGQDGSLTCWQCHPAHSFTGHNEFVAEGGEG